MEYHAQPVSQGLAQSASEREISELKQKILQLSDICQQFSNHVDAMESKMKLLEAKAQQSQNDTKISSSNSSTNYNEVDALKDKVKELVTMNVNWQKFNSQREKHIQEQNDKIAQLEKQLEAARMSHVGRLPESQQIEFDQLLLANKHKCDTLEDEKSKIEDENHQLKRRLESLERQVFDQQRQLADLVEHKQLLEAQVVMFEEDFKTERLDRERAQSKIVELEIQVKELQKHQQVMYQPFSNRSSQLNPVEGSIIASPSEYAQRENGVSLRGRGLYQTDNRSGTFGKSQEWSTSKKYEGTNGFRRNGVNVYQTDGTADGVDETDVCDVVVLTEDSPACRRERDGVLSCPNCHKVFTQDHHLDLIDHLEICN